MKVKSSLHRYLAIIAGGWWKSLVSVFTLVLFSVSGAFGATYYWKGPRDTSASATGGAWSTLSNWSTEGADGADAATPPGSSDKFYGLENRAIDLEGKEWTIGGWDSTGDWNRYNMALWNGTLKVVGDVKTHSDTIFLRPGAKLVFAVGTTFTPSSGATAPEKHWVNSNTELDILGNLNIYMYELVVHSGGTAVINPTKWDISVNTAQKSFLKTDGGILSLPNGISFSSGSSKSGFGFSLELTGNGTIALGAPVKKNSKPGTYAASFGTGTLRVTGDVYFDFDSVTIPDDAALTLDVDAGASFDYSGIIAGTETSIVKVGMGDILFFGSGLPTTTTVSAGGFALCSDETSYDLSSVTFAVGTTLKIGATGITLSATDASIANATFAALDGYVPSSGATVLTCADSSVLAQAQAGLNASLASVGISVEIDGNSLVAESHYTFNSSTVSDMNDATGWVNNLAAPAGQPVIIGGSQTAAVMDGAVPAYSAIAVTDGATLTVAATRDLPAATLTAGTALSVASQGSTIVMEDRAYSDYILDTPTLVGTMSPLRDLAEITDISGNVGGGWFGNQDKLYTYVVTKVLDNGSRLHVQFIRNESDWTKCAIVDFTKDDLGNIYATGVGAGYIESTDAQVDFDAIEYNQAAYGSSDTSGAYGVKRLSFRAPVVYGGSATVTATGDFATTGSGSVTIDVAADCVLDLSGVDVTTEAGLVKTGDGTLVMGDELPTQLSVAVGALVLQPHVEYDMSGVTLGEDATVKVAIDGTFKPAVAKVSQSGTTVYMAGDTYVGVGGWDTLANWASGALPDASAVVHIYGSETVLTVDAVPATMPAAIVVEGGATLSVAVDMDLPPVTVVPGATLDIASGAAVSIANGFSSSALVDGDDVTLPVLSIQSGATLNVPANTKFKNIDLRIFGTISETAKGHLYLGYAERGETTYFAMNATNATISTIGAENSYAQGQLWVACSDVGGRVSVMRRIELNGVALDVSKYDGLYIGSNNPVDEPFEVLLENITKQYRGYWSFCGAVTATFRNCALSRPEWQAWEAQGKWNVIDAAKLIYENTTHYYEYPDGNSVNWSPVTSGAECFVLTNSTVMWSRPTGNHKGVMTVFDSFYDCAYDAYAPSKGQTLPDLFQGLGALNIPAASFCAIRAKDHVTWDANDDATERICKIDADVVFTGAGDLVVSNSVAGRYFEVTMQSGNNTCTGTLATYSPENFDAKFYFANGANWAGTVVAGNVALTNLTDGAAATVTFGTLDLAADFPIRVWKSEGVYSSDVINVGSFINNGGRLAPVMMSAGEDFAKGDSFVVGKIAKGAALPAVANGWALKTRSIDGDDEYDEIVLKSGVGFQVVIR